MFIKFKYIFSSIRHNIVFLNIEGIFQNGDSKTRGSHIGENFIYITEFSNESGLFVEI